jgi:hypothetical protein
MLVTDVPAGFTLNTKATGNSGTSLQAPAVASIAPKSKCGDLSATSFITTTGLTGVSFAQSDYIDKANNEISQELDAYRPGGSAEVMTRMRKVLAQCATFPLKAAGIAATERIKTSEIRGLGQDAVQAVVTAPQFYGGTTLIVARVGDNVVSAFYNDTSGSYDDGHLLTIVRKLVANVQTAS